MHDITKSKRNAFTLVELLTVIALIGLLVTMITPNLMRARKLTYRTACAKNLQEIARACFTYATDQSFHRFSRYPGTLPSIDPTKLKDTTWFKMDSAKNGNATCLWLLIDTNFLTRKVFLCPAARGNNYTEPLNTDTYFKPNTCSYSYVSMVGYVPGSDPKMAFSSQTTPAQLAPSYVLLADKNPCVNVTPFSVDPAKASKNSENHDGEGQNIVRMDQSVEWITSNTVKNQAGQDDNIYMPDSGSSLSSGTRAYLDDAFVIP